MTIAALDIAMARGDTAEALSVIRSLLAERGVTVTLDEGLDHIAQLIERLELIERSMDRLDKLEKRFDSVVGTLNKAQIRNPLDHDGDGRAGGSLPKAQRTPK